MLLLIFIGKKCRMAPQYWNVGSCVHCVLKINVKRSQSALACQKLTNIKHYTFRLLNIILYNHFLSAVFRVASYFHTMRISLAHISHHILLILSNILFSYFVINCAPESETAQKTSEYAPMMNETCIFQLKIKYLVLVHFFRRHFPHLIG